MFGNINSPSRKTLSPTQALRLFNFYMQGTRTIDDDNDIVMELCFDADSVLSRIQKSPKKPFASMSSGSSISSGSNEDMALRQGIASAYYELARVFEQLGHPGDAQRRDKKAEKWGYVQGISNNINNSNNISRSSRMPIGAQVQSVATISKDIFNHNDSPTIIRHSLPDADTHLNDTHQLVYCLGLLSTASVPTTNLTDKEKEWCHIISADKDEYERLHKLASDVIEIFSTNDVKAETAVVEVVSLAPALDQIQFRTLLMALINGISQNIILGTHLLEGLAQLIQRGPLGCLDSDDLVSILNILSSRLQGTHTQSGNHLYRLSATVSHVLDAMVNSQVKGLKREQLHEPLAAYLKGLKGSSNPHLVYQAAYAFQALLYIPDDESTMQGMLRRTSAVFRGVFGIVSAVKDMNMNAFIDEISNIQKGLPSVTDITEMSLQVYKGTTSLYESGATFRECMEEGLSFSRKSGWYPALRVADGLLQTGELTKFKTLVCGASCRNEAAFQWGLCQRLGQIVADAKWSMDTRQDAIMLLGEIYKNDQEWGCNAHIKQWIVNILRHLSSLSLDGLQVTNTLLNDLERHGDVKKQDLYRSCLQAPLIQCIFTVTPPPAPPTHLLDRVQKKPGFEDSLRQLKRRRMETGDDHGFYIQQYAKASPQASDDKLFLLMDKVKEFLDSDQKVMLVQGDSGAGKSTFNRTLERTLWETYQKRHGRIPLFINLPAIDKPEKDLVAKQLRDYGFTDLEIKELKMNRSFILICDGYDESMQTNNLYASNQLNKAGEWKGQMVISCRSEYLGSDYRDRFQPMDRNHRADSGLFQEAVIVPFSETQIEDYIEQYVDSMDLLWGVEDYKRALKMIPSLQELVRNPFILSMSLEVLPRMVDPSQDISNTKIKRVTLYDQFVELWLERGKKRLGETLRPEDRKMFRIFTDEGFAQNGVKYLTELAIAIYKHQDGNPVVEYSPFKDKGTWKEMYFSKENRRNLLREASPLTRTGNQHRFMHRSNLEYSLVRSIFEPQPVRSAFTGDGEAKATTPHSRRQSISSVFSFEGLDIKEGEQEVDLVEADETSPLVWRSFVDEPSIIHFLEDRVRLEPVFKRQLYTYVELSKDGHKWRIAAANAMTILIRSGESFIGADLRGIQIPGADVSHGIFENAQLQGADLRKVNLRKCWLRGANLSGAKMAGVQFGEWPLIEASGKVLDGTYSPDGKTLAVVIEDNPSKRLSIIIYDTSSWEELLNLRNKAIIDRLVYSPDSRHIASWDYYRKAVIVVDIKSGAIVRKLVGSRQSVFCLAYSPSGNDLASADLDESVRVWDTQTGILKFRLEGLTNDARTVVYSPDGKQIATGSGDKILRLWDATSGQLIMMLMDHKSRVDQIEYSPNGQEIITRCDFGHFLYVWDVGTGQKKFELKHDYDVRGIQYSPNGRFAASFAESHGSGTIYQWDMQTGKAIHTLKENVYSITNLRYSPNGEEIVTCGWSSGAMQLWNARSGQLMNTLHGHSERIDRIVYSPSNHQLASFSRDGTVRLWDTRPQQSNHDLHNHSSRIRGVRNSPDGQQIASYSGDGTVRIWDARTGQSIRVLQCPDGSAGDIKYLSDDHLLISYSPNVYLWDVRTGQVVRTLKLQNEQDNKIYTINFSPIDHQIACGYLNGDVTIWDAYTGELIHKLQYHKRLVASIAFSPDGRQIASYDLFGYVRLWRAQSGDLQYAVRDTEWDEDFDEEPYYGNDIAYTPDGQKILVYRELGYQHFQVWDIETSELYYEDSFQGVSWVMAFSPCSQQLAFGVEEGEIKVVDLKLGKELHILSGHREYLNELSYSPDGRYIASSGSDMIVRLWDLKTGQCLVSIPLEGGAVSALVWNAVEEGYFLFTGSEDASVRMWQIVEEDEEYQYYLKWSTRQTVLNASKTQIQDVDGLSELNRKVLVQHGAIDKQSPSLAVHKSTEDMIVPSTASKTEAISGQVDRHQGPSVETAPETGVLARGGTLTKSIGPSKAIKDYWFKYSVCNECNFAHVISCRARDQGDR